MDNLKLFPGDTLYLKLYNFLKKDIEDKKILSKLPSIRKLAKNFNISIFTVIRAYELLEKDGYVASKKGSGFFIKIIGINIFFTLKIIWQMKILNIITSMKIVQLIFLLHLLKVIFSPLKF